MTILEYIKLRRNVVAFFCFFGTANLFLMRINLSVAIVDMTNNETSQVAWFDWNSKQKGNLLGAYYYGCIFTQIPAGYLAGRYGGVNLFGFGLGTGAILTLLTPICAKFNYYAFVALQVLKGITMGVTFPAISMIFSKWAPPAEITRLLGISFSGIGVGIVVGFSASGLITHALGWPYAFYIPGSLCLLWYVLWFLYVTDNPIDDPYITTNELKYLEEYSRSKQEKLVYPWKAILTSAPIWALIISSICETWVGSLMLTYLPIYLKHKFNYSTGLSGCLLTLPYIAQSVVPVVGGIIADKLRRKRFTTTQVRKMLNCSASINEALFVTLIGFTDSPIVVMTCLTLCIGIGSMTLSGSGVNALDLAPRYAGIISGIVNTFSTTAGILSPNIAGYILRNETMSEWRLIFLITSVVCVVSAISYGALASGVKQPWADNNNQRIIENKEEAKKMCSIEKL